MKYRTEKDSIGERNIPLNALYGIHTARALENFPSDGVKVPVELIQSIILIKRCAAEVSRENSFIEASKADAIISACDKLLEQLPDEAFPLPFMQGGAGTSVNMNVNEVIANLAIQSLGGVPGDYHLIHPNDDVNRFQSTNDVYPSALKIAAIQLLIPLANSLADLQSSLQGKEREFADIIKVGRTEMRDAVPVTLGQEFGAYAEAAARDRWRVFKCEERLRVLNIGGTAVGTGLNAPKIYIFRLIEELRKATGLGISRAENSIDMTQNADVFAEVSGILKTVAVNYIKISHDLRLLSSGPYGEINLPARQAGSSIMPGKVNPVIPEYAASVGIQVIANDSAITQASSMGQLELNAFLPVVAYNLIQSIKLLTDAAVSLKTNCIDGITANTERCRDLLEQSDAPATLLAPYIGYEKSAEVVSYAREHSITIRNAAIGMKLLTAGELDIIFDTRHATSPGISGSKELKDKLNLKKESDNHE
jgi:aspartate ammonia-lyase